MVIRHHDYAMSDVNLLVSLNQMAEPRGCFCSFIFIFFNLHSSALLKKNNTCSFELSPSNEKQIHDTHSQKIVVNLKKSV